MRRSGPGLIAPLERARHWTGEIGWAYEAAVVGPPMLEARTNRHGEAPPVVAVIPSLEGLPQRVRDWRAT